MTQFAIATEANGIILQLKLPLMSKAQADKHASTLRTLTDSPIYVINTKSE